MLRRAGMTGGLLAVLACAPAAPPAAGPATVTATTAYGKKVTLVCSEWSEPQVIGVDGFVWQGRACQAQPMMSVELPGGSAP